MRILVTGSRGWEDWEFVWKVLDGYRLRNKGPLYLVHGDHHSGVDYFTKLYAGRYMGEGVLNTPYPVTKDDWNTMGRGAGPVRNQRMVDSGANECLAFISRCTSPRCRKEGLHPSDGATHCRNMAVAANIPTKTFYTVEVQSLLDKMAKSKKIFDSRVDATKSL